ncbi:MAG: hypothetical protein WAW59_07150 [Patescibacteria group bacterium]
MISTRVMCTLDIRNQPITAPIESDTVLTIGVTLDKSIIPHAMRIYVLIPESIAHIVQENACGTTRPWNI